MKGAKTYVVVPVQVERFKSGPRAGELRPFRVPADAQIVGLDYGLVGMRVFYVRQVRS